MDTAKPKIHLFLHKRIIIIIYVSLYILQYRLYILQARRELRNMYITLH